jgi:hypothetical protein
MRTAALLQFGGIALNPALNRRVIDVQTSFLHDLFEISIAERIPEIPPGAE